MSEYSPSELAAAFCREVASECAPLSTSYGLESAFSVVSSRDLSREIAPEEVGDSFFLIRASLDNEACHVEITYGDREFDVNTTISHGDGDRFGLSEWNEALGLDDPIQGSAGWVIQLDRIPGVVREIVLALSRSLPEILARGPEAQQRLQEARVRRHESAVKDEHDREYRRISIKATEAFRIGDYAQTVALLSDVVPKLSPSDEKKLKYAHKKLGS